MIQLEVVLDLGFGVIFRSLLSLVINGILIHTNLKYYG
jgi:hypothetical protein